MERYTPGSSPVSLDDLPLLLRIDEAAALARVTRRTVSRWADDELFRTVKPLRGRGSSPRLVDRDSFLAFLGLEDA